MTPIPTTLSVSDARANLYDMMDEVQKYHRRFIITHHGKPQAVLISIEDLESLEETIEILSNKKLMADIHQSEKGIRTGKYYTLEEVMKEIGLKKKKS